MDKIIGYFLISIPFGAFLIISLRFLGWKCFLAFGGIAILVIGLVAGGAYLVADG